MQKRGKSLKEKREEQQLRNITQLFEKRGVTIRREKLSRGHSYRVKSGDCQYAGTPHVFLDRRLPVEQQISVLIDYLLDFRFQLSDDELEPLSVSTRSLLEAKAALFA